VVTVPARFADVLVADTLDALTAALAPPAEQRAKVTFDVEVEVVGEGTFTLSYDKGALRGKKGFAKKPLLSARLDKAAWPLLRDELQAAVDHFPKAPELHKRLVAVRAVSAVEAEAATKAVTSMAEGLCIHFDISGAGRMSIARGPVDEATRELTIGLDGARIRGLLDGAAATTVTATMKGDRSVGTAVVAAMAPVMRALKA